LKSPVKGYLILFLIKKDNFVALYIQFVASLTCQNLVSIMCELFMRQLLIGVVNGPSTKTRPLQNLCQISLVLWSHFSGGYVTLKSLEFSFTAKKASDSQFFVSVFLNEI